MGKGGGGTDKMQGGGGGCKIKGEEGRGWQWGALCLVLLGATRLLRGVAGNCNRGGGGGIGEGGGTVETLADLANVQQKEMREDQDNAVKRGRQSPVKRWGIWIAGSRGGDDDAGIRNLFICQEYYLVLRLPLTC